MVVRGRAKCVSRICLTCTLEDPATGRSFYGLPCAESNTISPDLVVIAGDVTDGGYPDQYPVAKAELSALTCPHVLMVPGNHDARNVGYLGFEDIFGSRDTRNAPSPRRTRCRRGSRSTHPSPTWTRVRSAGSTTARSRKDSPVPPTSASLSAITISCPSRDRAGTRSSTREMSPVCFARPRSTWSSPATDTRPMSGRSAACCSSIQAPSRRFARVDSRVPRTS
jgi:hypothetical protein